jgi:predicted acyltransferase
VSAAASGRIASLDAFRGFAIASMVLVNNPGDWGHIHAPLGHAAWNGWTFTDLVFPFFLFAAGVSMAVSIARRTRAGDAPRALMGSVLRRAVVIFLVGLALNLFPAFDFSTVRIPGVLQRIALCIVIAAPLAIYARTRSIAVWIVLLLAAYSLLILFAPVPGHDGVVAAGALEPGRDFGAWLDRKLLAGHLWTQSRTWDPEGIASTIPAACSVLFGVITGRWLLAVPSDLITSGMLFSAGVAALGIGLMLDELVMPINKNLWSPSYCVFMTGWSLAVFAAFHAVMDARTFARRALLPLTIFGMNALFIFAFSGLVARLLIMGDAKRTLYAPLLALPIAPENASLAFAIAFSLAMFAVAWALWKKKWFVKA